MQIHPIAAAAPILQRTLRVLQERGLIERAFYQRKPPGMRWRVAACDVDAVRERLRRKLDTLQASGSVGSWTFCIYEPETFMFGGSAAMRAVHDYFAADCDAWVRLFHVYRHGDLRATVALLSIAQLNELFARCLASSPEEIWDIWCRLAAFHGAAPARERSSGSRPLLAHVSSLAQTAAATRPLQQLARANDALATQLCALEAQGRLQQGLRGVLATVALFHWNRIGLTTHHRQRCLQRMTAAWHPGISGPLGLMPSTTNSGAHDGSVQATR
jgi:thiopeptide-type bacteriocin biosynthesis protein